ncbi:MAG: hypothetical protein B7Y98_03450 [Sphingomonas sp. 32-62-10]|nr:MAG: hypothetical protein B7Y98_03450 [Sphingomonas sp. 32-62-10]
MEDPGTGKSQRRYERWCGKWLVPMYTHNVRGEPHVFFSAQDCFQARCSLLHEGTVEMSQKPGVTMNRIAFFSLCSSDTNQASHTVDGVQQSFLQVRVSSFCERMFRAVDQWDEAMSGDPRIKAAKESLLVIHSPGAKIGGVHWG